MTHKLYLPAAALLLAGTAASPQNSQPSQPLPGLDNFSIPSSRPTPQRVPEPEPTVRPSASATPRATPPAVVPTVLTTPAPLATPTPTSARATTPRAAATPHPARPVPVVTPVPQSRPTEASPVAPVPLATTAPSVEQPAAVLATPQPEPVATPAQGATPGIPFWIWAMAGCMLLALLIGSVGWWWPRLMRARVREREASEDREIVVLAADEPTAPPTIAPEITAPPVARTAVPHTPPLAPPPTRERARLDLELIPTRAGIDPAGLVVDYLIVVRNAGKVAASGVWLDVRLLGAGPNQDLIIGALFGTPIAKPISPPFDLPAGSTIELGGSGTHPRDTLEVMTIAGQAAVVPVLAVNVEYDWAGGHGQTAQSYVIGIARGGAEKLQPFRLDPPRMYGNVSALDYTVAVVS